MSDYEMKCGVRANIKFLRGKNRTEAYDYFSSILGPAEDVDEYDGKIDYFIYKGDYQPQDEYSYGETEDDGWFVDYVVAEGSPFEETADLYLPLNKLTEIIIDLKEKFSIEDEDISVFSYTWYNGSDEPRHIVPPKHTRFAQK